MADGELDVAIMSGSVRNSENEHVCKLLRRKSKVFVAYGACASMGGIPGLANLVPRQEIFERAYLTNPSIEPGNRTVPLAEVSVNGYSLELPKFYDRVYKLDQIIDVDYYVPGCPPQPDQCKAAVLALVAALTGQADPPPKGAVVGAFERALCDDCPREKAEKKIARFYRPWEIMQDPEKCLMEQGIFCAGMATRSGCGVRCPNSGIPCRGCYGPAPGVADQGAKLVSAVASIVDSKDPAEIEAALATLPDFVSFANRYSVPASPLQRSHRQ
jgi:F420-non-reducing hydrogenase small subunit